MILKQIGAIVKLTKGFFSERNLTNIFVGILSSDMIIWKAEKLELCMVTSEVLLEVHKETGHWI